MKHKWIIVMLSFVLLVTGCAPSIDPTEDATTEPTVSDQFTDPTTAPTTNPTEPTQNSNSGGTALGPSVWSKDEKGHCVIYEGGEMHLPFSITASGTRAEHEMGILLFVDGQIQPYKTSKNDIYSYMHVFAPEDDVELETDLIFVPVCGTEGDSLEIWYTGIYWPDYSYLEDGSVGMVLSKGAPEAGTRLKMEATPSEEDYPAVMDRVISCAVSQEALTSKDTRGWTELDFQERCEFSFKVNPDEPMNQRSCYVWNISEDQPVKVRFEVWGNPYVHYGLVIFLDNEPVSVATEDLMFLTVEEGYKTVVDVELDMAGFDGESSVYAALIPRNARSTDILTMSWLNMADEFLLYDECPLPDMP